MSIDVSGVLIGLEGSKNSPLSPSRLTHKSLTSEMIRRSPTEVPLRQEDVVDFIARLQEKKSGPSSSTGQPTGTAGNQSTSNQAKEKSGAAAAQPINMVQVNREARAGMTRESRLGM